MSKLLLIAAGGCLGAVARYLCAGFAQRISAASLFPVGTLVVNVLGCFIIGVVMGLIEEKALLGSSVRSFLVIGTLGSFTTFSSFGYETVELMQDGQMSAAGLNILLNVLVGVGAVMLGRFTMNFV